MNKPTGSMATWSSASKFKSAEDIRSTIACVKDTKASSSTEVFSIHLEYICYMFKFTG